MCDVFCESTGGGAVLSGVTCVCESTGGGAIVDVC